MKKKIALITFLGTLLCLSLFVGTPVQAAESVANNDTHLVTFENLPEETKAIILADGVDIEKTEFYQSNEIKNDIRPRAYIGTVIDWYNQIQKHTFSSNVFTKESKTNIHYKEIRVPTSFSYTELSYKVKEVERNSKYVRVQLKVIRQYTIW